MSYGKKIAYLRKTKNMTQSDLGTLLNVTFQAVSKWERDESSPDFETMSKMAKYFNVPLSYFEEEQIVFEPALSVISPEQNAVLGVCTQCGKMLHEGEQSEESEVLICKQCVRRGEEAAAALAEQHAFAEENKLAEKKKNFYKMRNKGLIWGAIACGFVLVLGIAAIISSEEGRGMLSASTFGMCLFLFSFVSQLFWDGAVAHFCSNYRLVGTPGVIFTFDWDGLKFLIGIKILFACIRLVVFIVSWMFFMMIGLIVSPFTFIPAFIRVNNFSRYQRESE